jgi:hypothetical protein
MMFRTDLRSNRTRHRTLLTDTSAIAKFKLRRYPRAAFGPASSHVLGDGKFRPAAHLPPLTLSVPWRIVIHHSPPRCAFIQTGGNTIEVRRCRSRKPGETFSRRKVDGQDRQKRTSLTQGNSSRPRAIRLAYLINGDGGWAGTPGARCPALCRRCAPTARRDRPAAPLYRYR